jgi:site-specific DNA recombinase
VNTKQVGIWIRVSTEDQARGESPEHHERRAKAYAESKGWDVREVYHLEAVSGKLVMAHPEAQRMLAHVASGRITGLIFSKLARLARNTRELLDFADIFREHDADLISLQESIDTSTSAGRLFYTMIAAMAQWEREEIAERVAASVPIRAKMGKPLGGAAPFGYRWENRQLVPDSKEAPVRKLIYELFREHRRKKAVARILNERGYRTRNGSKFSDTTVIRLMRDWTAKGIRRANYTRSQGAGKRWDIKDEKDWVLIPVEPIVSEELWTECNAILNERSECHAVRRGRPPVHLFTGIVYCRCGERMYVPSKSRKYVCYKCRMKVGIADLEAVFLEHLKGFLIEPEDIARHIADADGEIKAREERIGTLEAECSRVRSDREKLFRLYTGDHLSPESFAERNGPLEERLRAIEEEIPRLQGELDFAKIQFLSRDEILAVPHPRGAPSGRRGSRAGYHGGRGGDRAHARILSHLL